jgi:hypothetical protein
VPYVQAARGGDSRTTQGERERKGGGSEGTAVTTKRIRKKRSCIKRARARKIRKKKREVL